MRRGGNVELTLPPKLVLRRFRPSNPSTVYSLERASAPPPCPAPQAGAEREGRERGAKLTGLRSRSEGQEKGPAVQDSGRRRRGQTEKGKNGHKRRKTVVKEEGRSSALGSRCRRSERESPRQSGGQAWGTSRRGRARGSSGARSATRGLPATGRVADNRATLGRPREGFDR